MLERIKKFYEENRFEIVVVGGLVLLVAGTALITKKVVMGQKAIIDSSLSHISFIDKGFRIPAEEVKLILDDVSAVNQSFAFIHNAGEADKYIALRLS